MCENYLLHKHRQEGDSLESISFAELFCNLKLLSLISFTAQQVTQAEIKLFFEAACGEVYRLRLLGDYHHPTRIGFVEFVMVSRYFCPLSNTKLMKESAWSKNT